MWFFNKQIKSSIGSTPVSDKIAAQIAGSLIKIQTAFSTRMNNRLKKMSLTKLKIGLICFCLIVGGYCMFLIVGGVTRKNNQSDNFVTSRHQLSRYFKRPTDKVIEPGKNITEETFLKIQQFKNYMDSLKQQNSYLYDSILKNRPLLMDSVLKLEKMYLSQNQK